MPVWKGQLGYLICNKLESTIHQITTLAILTMLAVWVTLVALVSVLSCSVNSPWLFGLKTKSYLVSLIYRLLIAVTVTVKATRCICPWDLWVFALVCSSVNSRTQKLKPDLSFSETVHKHKLRIIWIKNEVISRGFDLLITDSCCTAVTLKSSLCICRWDLWLFALVCSSVNSRTQKQKTWRFIDCILFWNST